MNPKNLSPFLALFFVLFFALAIQGCTPSYCGVPEYVVTKFNDTNDGVCDGDCSLREAVINSNVCPGAQTIRLPAGIYDLSIAGTLEDAAATGDLDLTDDVTIIGEGAPFIDANGIDRVFEVFDTATVDLHTMLIRGGEEQVGAGIRNWGTLTMHGGVVANNTGVFPDGIMGGSSGGGIFSDGTLVLLGTQVRENSADMGGGIMIDDPGTFEMSTGSTMINGNIAHETGGGLAVAFGAEATLTGVDIWRNEAGFDGGGIFNAGLITMRETAVYENSAGLEGGGLHSVFGGHTVGWEIRFEDNEAERGGAILTSGLINLYQSSLNDNRATAGAGGAAYVDGALPGLQLRNTTVSGNSATLAGSAGGLHSHGGDMLLEFITVAENDPLGIVNDAGGNVVIKSSIVADNSAGNCTGIGLGSSGYNLDDGTSCNFTEPSDLSSTDPMLGPLAYNG
ncbi:MAG: CSLREA domain-containing protein, partial [Anaerolineales bacterium]|nr:CSLREA domain-containing protein [Anaerolineales bacterium]